MWEFLTVVSLLFLVGGFLILRDKGITFRRWLFISVLAVLFMMTAAYGAQLSSRNSQTASVFEFSLKSIVELPFNA
jgi:hypothetical protein